MLQIGIYAARGMFWLGALALADKTIKDAKGTVTATGEAAQKSASLMQWVAVGGMVYAGYRVAQKQGFAK